MLNKIILYVTVVFIFLFSNCKSNEISIEEKLIGTWELYEIQDNSGGSVPSSGSQITYFKDHLYSNVGTNSLQKGSWSVQIIDKKGFLTDNILSQKFDDSEQLYSQLADGQWLMVQKRKGNIKVFENIKQEIWAIKYIDSEKLILKRDSDTYSHVYKRK